ncbi:MAG TPA: alpha/beta hydrolase [Cellvibrio sp.]|nr:alpha/beta hydrolase [Cellvibrio sp.]
MLSQLQKTEIPLVLIPGFMLDESLWDEMVEQLPISLEVYRASLEKGQTIPQIVEHIALAAPERFILVGFSLGGYVARSLVEQFPERVVALVLIASSLRPDTPEQKRLKAAAVSASSHNRYRGLGSAAITKSFHPKYATDKALIERVRNMGMRLGFDEFSKQSALERGAFSPHNIHCPTLVIAAAQDGLRSAEEAYELSNAIPGSRLHFIENAGHMIPIEQPEVLSRLIIEWLDGINL